MAKQSVRAEVNNFVGGLITEASPLNFPPNASLDEENFELNRDGTRDRRLGIGYEPNSALVSAGMTSGAALSAKFSTFKWKGVNGVPAEEFLVVQIEKVLKLFDLSADSISGSGLVATIELSLFPISTIYSFTSIEGRLVVAAGVDTIAVVSYTAGVGATVSYEPLKVRDAWGVEVTGAPGYETDPTFRSGFDIHHHYNLQNQSWGVPRKDSAGTLVDPVLNYTSLGVYPSNSEVVWTGLQFSPVTSGAPYERLFSNMFEDRLGADVKATKGYYIINLLRRGQSRLDEYNNNKLKYPTIHSPALSAPLDLSSGGARLVSEFAGRVFYSGFSGEVVDGDARSPNLSNYVLFSQLVRNKSDFVKCYQEGDPTSRENTDLLDTDGGFIRIAGAKVILGLLDLESHLVIIADNGVWTLTGGNDFGFSATNYKVSKISAFGGLSASSVVIEGGRAFFWSEDGIHVVAKDQFGSFGVTNITQSTIQTLYESIPNTSKVEATGIYDQIGKKIRWLYKTGSRFEENSVTKELVLDTVLNVFYQNKIGKLSPNVVEVMGLFPSDPFKQGDSSVQVYADVDLVLSNTDTVIVDEAIRTTGVQGVRYLTLVVSGGQAFFTFSFHNNVEFLDWKETNGVGIDAKAFLLTGAQTAKDSAVSKQMPYLIMYMLRTEQNVTPELVPDNPSGCLMRAQWDFANSINSNKWTPLMQVYRQRRAQYVVDAADPYDNGFELVVSKNKMRGRGKAFSLYLESEPLKDCRILGWSISLNGNSNV